MQCDSTAFGVAAGQPYPSVDGYRSCECWSHKTPDATSADGFHLEKRMTSVSYLQDRGPYVCIYIYIYIYTYIVVYREIIYIYIYIQGQRCPEPWMQPWISVVLWFYGLFDRSMLVVVLFVVFPVCLQHVMSRR